MKAVAETLEVARSHLHDKVRHSTKPRGPYRKPDDALNAAGSTPGRRAADLWLSPDHSFGE